MLDNTILAHLVFTEDYTRRVLPFLKEEYFHNPNDKLIFNLISDYIRKYNGTPSREALLIELDGIDNLPEAQYTGTHQTISNLSTEETNVEWLVDNTEKFCQDKAIYNAVMQSIQILDGRDPNHGKGAIPKLLSDALSVSFDTNIGHDYLENAEDRFEFYNRDEARIPFDLEMMNKITNGGLPNKTLNVILAGTGVGKTLAMGHMAAGHLMQGKNVLYITMEMAEERIAERIDAHLLNVPLQDLKNMTKKQFDDRISRIRKKTVGKLIVKEYPTASAHTGHFRALINELRLKKNFVPDVIYIDYLNICASSRVKGLGTNVNSYALVKSIAEELRGLAVEFNVPVITATQTNRGGYNDSDVDLTNTSESFGLPMTADFMFALISSEELEALGQVMVKQLKNRYGSIEKFKRFVLGVDRSKMRLYDVEQSAQDLADSGQDDIPVFDQTQFARETEKEKKERFKTLYGDDKPDNVVEVDFGFNDFD